MARVIFSALLSGASGKIGDVVASRWKGIPYFRRRVIPANPQSGDQCKQRHILKVALLLWQSIKASAKAPWDHAVSAEPISGYNDFMDKCIAALKPQFTAGATKEDPTWSDPAVTVGMPYNPAYAALLSVNDGTPGNDEMTFTWVKRAGCVGANHVRAWYRPIAATAWTQFGAEDETAQTITFTGLTEEGDYEFMLFGLDIATAAFSQSTHKIAEPTHA